MRHIPRRYKRSLRKSQVSAEERWRKINKVSAIQVSWVSMVTTALSQNSYTTTYHQRHLRCFCCRCCCCCCSSLLKRKDEAKSLGRILCMYKIKLRSCFVCSERGNLSRRRRRFVARRKFLPRIWTCNVCPFQLKPARHNTVRNLFTHMWKNGEYSCVSMGQCL